jgi:glucose-6-phosphate 1-dehydrogenase
MSQIEAPVIVIFGITGDLSKRKLLPALYHLLSQELLPAETKIVGISRHALTVEELLSTVELCVLEKDKICDPEGLARVNAALQTHQLDPDNSGDYTALAQLLDSFDNNRRRNRLFYMAVPSSAYSPIVQHLADAGLNDERSRLLLEKPFGYDLASAEQLIKVVDHSFSERQVYRIDHYLAKETAQNLLTFRMHNPIFASLWSGEHVKQVHIRATETIGVEGRANFYEQTGALRDFVQSHLMQLLSITLMDLPADMSSAAIHASKQRFFDHLLPADPNQAVRGQYESYKLEVNNPDSTIETYARLKLKHDSDQWRDTEIILETGKAMSQKTTEITLSFKTPHERRRNALTFVLQPDEGISLDLVVKAPGFENQMHHTALDFHYQSSYYQSSFTGQHIDAYERVLIDAIRGDQSLFASDRDVLATWRVLQPVLDAWQASNHDLAVYPVGSNGPQIYDN